MGLDGRLIDLNRNGNAHTYRNGEHEVWVGFYEDVVLTPAMPSILSKLSNRAGLTVHPDDDRRRREVDVLVPQAMATVLGAGCFRDCRLDGQAVGSYSADSGYWEHEDWKAMFPRAAGRAEASWCVLRDGEPRLLFDGLGRLHGRSGRARQLAHEPGFGLNWHTVQKELSGPEPV